MKHRFLKTRQLSLGSTGKYLDYTSFLLRVLLKLLLSVVLNFDNEREVMRAIRRFWEGRPVSTPDLENHDYFQVT